MANEEHLALLKQGVEAWNKWREANRDVKLYLTGAYLDGAHLTGAYLDGAHLTGANLTRAHLIRADLTGAHLTGADLTDADLTDAHLTGTHLTGANLTGANLTGADLTGADLIARLTDADLTGADLTDADLTGANLTDADLTGANLTDAHLTGANLTGADLTGANLTDAHLIRAHLTGANLTRATLSRTVLGDINLSNVKGLETCRHIGPSIIDHLTLQRSGPLSRAFLRGVGLPENLIDYLPSLLNQAIQFYSCFISYSTKDQKFADRLHADLQNKGVRCWFAPHDMQIGDPIRSRIDEVIRVHERLLLVLSKHSISSDWVEKEVETAFEQERRGKKTVLFPVRLDNTILKCETGWPADIRRTRHIGDFTRWKDHDAYQKVLDRLLRDLKVERTEPS
jgi:uncharacterized protein YjbI with pentapeptide repeats